MEEYWLAQINTINNDCLFKEGLNHIFRWHLIIWGTRSLEPNLETLKRG